MNTALVWFAAYLLGSIPFGVLLAKARQVDLRSEGSGNIGATNVARTLGKKAGLLTLLGDCGKGFAACWLAGILLNTPWEVGGAGLLAYLGHVFSVFLKFKGGKGVATGLGIYCYLMPYAALSALALFVITTRLTGYVSVGSMLAAVSIPILGAVFQAPAAYLWVAAVAAAITVSKHGDNIRRLRAGTEAKFLAK